MRNNRGITFIALIVTIIILLILAGITINIILGENGIINKAKEAKIQTEIAQIKEKIQISMLGVQTDNYGDITEEQIGEILGKYGTISKEEETLTTHNGYKIKISDIWDGAKNGKGQIKKTIGELYDGYNNPQNSKYNENAMHIGDYVDYTAGEWNQVEKTTANIEPFTFGGYTNGKSRNTNATGSYTVTSGGVTYGKGKYEGWRIWDISEDKQTITLISAGCPEVYCHEYGEYNTEKILTGTTTGIMDPSKPFIPREWQEYINEMQYANTARAMQKSDLDTWYSKYMNSSIPRVLPLNTANKLISTVENGYYYWLCTMSDDAEIYLLNPASRGVEINKSNQIGNDIMGVRILVSLTSNVKFNNVPEKIEQDGFSYNKWIIE